MYFTADIQHLQAVVGSGLNRGLYWACSLLWVSSFASISEI